MNNYIYIDPDNFEVREVIKLINKNLEYVYKNQTSITQTVVNLIPYSDFSVISNTEYWKPYMESNFAITDNNLSVYSSKNTVGVMTPAIVKTINAGDYYTLLLKCRINCKDSYLNEFYVVDEQMNKYRINHDLLIPYNNSGIILKTFTLSQTIQNPRFIIGSSDVEQEIIEPFKYRDIISDSSFIYEGLLLPYIDSHKVEFDKNIVPLKETLQYLLVNFDIDLYRNLRYYFVDDKLCANYNLLNSSKEVITNLETYLYHLIRLKHISIFNSEERSESIRFFATEYNSSPIRGAFPLVEGSSDYSFRLALIVLDAINYFMPTRAEYTGEDLNGNAFSLTEMRTNIISFISSLPELVYSSKYIYGGFRVVGDTRTYLYLDRNNSLSPSEIDIATQLELYRLFIICGVTFEVDSNLKSLMSYEFTGFENTYLMPDLVRNTDYLLPDSILSVKPAFLYFKLLREYRHLFKDSIKICEAIVRSILSLKSTEGHYKYDYSVGGYIYSSNQYLESFLDGFDYVAPRTMIFEEISLCEGSNTENLNIINVSNGESLSKVEFTVKRVDTNLNKDEVSDLVGEDFVDKQSYQNTITSLSNRVNTLESSLTSDALYNLIRETVYSKTEIDAKVDELYNYINTHIQSSFSQMTEVTNSLELALLRIDVLEGKKSISVSTTSYNVTLGSTLSISFTSSLPSDCSYYIYNGNSQFLPSSVSNNTISATVTDVSAATYTLHLVAIKNENIVGKSNDFTVVVKSS